MVFQLAALTFNNAVQAQLAGREQQAAQLWAQVERDACRAQDLCPQSPQPPVLLASMYSQRGDRAGGVAVLRGALQAAQAARTDFGTAAIAFSLATAQLAKTSVDVGVAAFAGQDVRGMQVRAHSQRGAAGCASRVSLRRAAACA